MPQQDLPPDEHLLERKVWKTIQGTWKPLCGNFTEEGFSIEWHEFHTGEDLDWGKSFHANSLEVCLNYSGHGSLLHQERQVEIHHDQVAYYTVGDTQDWAATRHSGSIQRFLTIELSATYLQKVLQGCLGHLKKNVLNFIENPGPTPSSLEVMGMPSGFLALKMSFLEPPVAGAAEKVWYQSKILEVLSQICFREEEGEFFCHRQKRFNQERVEKVVFLLERDFENPPSLTMLAEEVGCSPFHLSRLFAQETGISIPKYLRVKRIEKAAEYLKSGKMNVTEAAMAVGYSSLSAFNKAFVEQMGCCPGLYPSARALTNRKPLKWKSAD